MIEFLPRRNGLRTLAATLAAALLLPPLTHADELINEADFFESLPTITAATRLEQQQRDLPAAVTLIDRAMIDASGAVNIADLIRLVPGFQVYHVHANKFGVVSHGQGETHPGRLEVMVDGRSVYSAVVSTVDWRALGITLDDIDHIEVVRGPNVATHGSNAFLGAINIVTRQPLQDGTARVSVTGGDLGTRIVNLSGNARVGALDLRLSGGYLENDGTGIGTGDDPVNGPGATITQRIPDGGEIGQLNLRGLYTPTLVDAIDFALGYSDGQFGMGNASHPDEFADREVTSHFQNLTWTRELSSGGQFKLQGFHNYTRYDQDREVLISRLLSDGLASSFKQPFLLPPGTPVPSWADLSVITGFPVEIFQEGIPNLDQIAGEPDQLVDLGAEEGSTHRYDLELEYTQPLGEQLRALAGVGWRLDRIKSVPQLNRDSYISEPFYRAFGNLEWKPSTQWTVNGGAMVEHNDLTGTRLSPRLGANWHLSPQHSVRTSIAQAYRTPSLLTWNQFSQVVLPSNGAVLQVEAATLEDLEPERVRSAEIGYLFHQPALRSTFDVRVFFEDLDNLVADFFRPLPSDLTEVGDDRVFENRNTAEWRNRGVELQWQLRPRAGTLIHAAYGYLSTDGTFDRGPLRPNERQPAERSPRHTLSLLTSQELRPGLTGSAAFYRMTGTFWFQGDDLPAYSRLDLQLRQRFEGRRVNASVALIVQGLLDDYLEFERNNDFGTRAFIRFNLDFL